MVVPASLRLTWAEELARWLPHLRPAEVHLIEGSVNRLPREHPYKVGPALQTLDPVQLVLALVGL